MSLPQRILVTGGSGVVGGVIVRHLVGAGVTPRALSRTQDSDRALEALGAEPVRGDVLDRHSLAGAMSGCELVFHAAGLNEMCPEDPDALDRVNVGGSLAVLRAAVAVGVQRIVYTSSAAAIGENEGTVGREDSPHRGWFLSRYERSKFLAEAAVMAEARRTGPEVVSVNPSSVQGPGRASGSVTLVLDLLRGRLPALVDTRLSLVDIDDCARGHLLAAERGRPGERYLLNSFTVSVRRAVGLLEEALGRAVPVRFVPGWAASAGAALVEAADRVRGRRPRVCREMVRTLRHGHAYDGSKAVRELGLAYTPPEDLFRRTVAWFRSEGLISV